MGLIKPLKIFYVLLKKSIYSLTYPFVALSNYPQVIKKNQEYLNLLQQTYHHLALKEYAKLIETLAANNLPHLDHDLAHSLKNNFALMERLNSLEKTKVISYKTNNLIKDLHNSFLSLYEIQTYLGLEYKNLENLKDFTRNINDKLKNSLENLVSKKTTCKKITTDFQNIKHNLQSNINYSSNIEHILHNLCNDISELGKSAEDVNIAMEQITVSINQIDLHANRTFSTALEVKKSAESGVNYIEQATTHINHIKDLSYTGASAMNELNQKINKIDNILQVIQEITDQTNLLAINATIIAANAGEHGRGFTIIAREIKSLAEHTNSSTKEIYTLMRDIQKQSHITVDLMAQNVNTVIEGVNFVQNTKEILNKLLNNTEHSNSMFKIIINIAKEQNKSIQYIIKAIAQIANHAKDIKQKTDTEIQEIIINSSKDNQLQNHLNEINNTIKEEEERNLHNYNFLNESLIALSNIEQIYNEQLANIQKLQENTYISPETDKLAEENANELKQIIKAL